MKLREIGKLKMVLSTCMQAYSGTPLQTYVENMKWIHLNLGIVSRNCSDFFFKIIQLFRNK